MSTVTSGIKYPTSDSINVKLPESRDGLLGDDLIIGMIVDVREGGNNGPPGYQEYIVGIGAICHAHVGPFMTARPLNEKLNQTRRKELNKKRDQGMG